MESIIPTSNLSLFIPAALILALTPGPVVLYIVTRSVEQGRKAGLISVIGLELGNFFHVFAAALGLSAILLSSALAFSVVKYIGAAYLIYLGVRKLRASDKIEDQNVKPDTLQRIFSQGIIVAIFNPKTALFFFAFLPQFVDPAAETVAFQIAFLGFLFVAMATVTDTLYALTAGAAGRWLRGNLRFRRFQRYLSGSVYIGLGVTTALASGGKK
jgi:threonine/homoserine/homoserine lactone efflux protein